MAGSGELAKLTRKEAAEILDRVFGKRV